MGRRFRADDSSRLHSYRGFVDNRTMLPMILASVTASFTLRTRNAKWQ
jgi:hypothetical protein